jgi:transposase InsO family protein
MAALCRQFGISRETGYVWLRRYRQDGAAAVWKECSRRPHTSPQQSPPELVEALKAARLARPDWGARKLAHVVREGHPDLPRVSTSTLQRILDREGLIQERDRQQIARKRFERERPNELWQMDFKGPWGFNQGIGPLSIQDDYSRYLLALKQLPTNTIQYVQATLEATFRQCGVPEGMLMDHGTPWYDSFGPWGWTELSVWLLRQGVHLTFSGIRHPQTQGKVERMHQALQTAMRKRKPTQERQAWLDKFRQEYNLLRPHEGIGMVTPATRWQPSSREFNPQVSDWQYPSGWITKRLAGEGQFWHGNRRWQVSSALRSQLVGLEVNGPRIVVYYCQMPIREINLENQTNVPLPGNPFQLLQC